MTARAETVDRAELERRSAEVERRIAAACARAGRPRSDVGMVAITKTHPPSVVRALVALGHRDIGESRTQELTAKIDAVADARWHFVGRLQRNKARELVGRVELVHSVDRRSLVDALARRAERAGTTQRILIQVNVGDDPAKGGCPAAETLALVRRARTQRGVRVTGLMTIPPLAPDGADPNEHARTYFARLRQLRDAAREEWPEVAELSMGMSADLEAGVECGATLVRVGRALLGPRRDPPWM